MSLKDWQNNGWLRPHKTSLQEVTDLFAIVERDLQDSQESGLSSDWRFGIAYNAALKLCTILIYASGYRSEKNLQHFRTLAALPLVLGDVKKPDATYLDACRVKRNTVEYDMAGVASGEDADELIEFVIGLKKEVLEWLTFTHPHLCT